MNSEWRAHQIRVRRATGKDAPIIQDILLCTWIATYGTFIPESDIRSYFDEHYSDDAIRDLLNGPEVEAFIAMWERMAAGSMITRRSVSEGRFYVSSLYVRPEFQGRGIGRELLLRGAEVALAAGFSEVWLGVMKQNVQALGWYRALGFSFGEELPFRMGRSSVSHLIGSIPLQKLISLREGQSDLSLSGD